MLFYRLAGLLIFVLLIDIGKTLLLSNILIQFNPGSQFAFVLVNQCQSTFLIRNTRFNPK